MIMFMCFCNIIGLGNPSNDALLTDFALAHILIVTAVILVGRRASVVWFLIVIAVLIYDVNKRGWDYKYHYLTPTEVKKYESGLEKKERWAMLRQEILAANRLNPPRATRYFNIWLVFILVSFLTAWSFGGVNIKILKIVPSIISNIENAIQSSMRIEFELEQKQKEATKSTLQLVQYSEVIENLNKEIDKLEYADKKKLTGVIQVIRQALDNAEAWEAFAVNFDSIYNNFFRTLQEKYPDLTPSEMKHLAYLKMNLSHSEIARLLNVKMESLRTLRYRLKKKLGIADAMELKIFVGDLKPMN
jgi:DNA-binding CsgD family transcriptional regulator